MMKKILIVDDEEKIRELIRINLELAGYECYEAEDGQKAIEKMENVKPDLALLDIMIPIRSGYEIAGNFIKNNIPIIFLTAKDSIVDKVKGLKSGADDYITKPFEAIELLARIETVLRRAGKETELFSEMVWSRLIDKNISIIDVYDAIKTKCSETLPAYEIPSYFEQVDRMPYTPNGKHDFRKLEELGNIKVIENKFDIFAKYNGYTILKDIISKNNSDEIMNTELVNNDVTDKILCLVYGEDFIVYLDDDMDIKVDYIERGDYRVKEEIKSAIKILESKREEFLNERSYRKSIRL